MERKEEQRRTGGTCSKTDVPSWARSGAQILFQSSWRKYSGRF